jgi:ubiquitin carboxyl-terminal hydrolase 5/13
MGFTAIQAEKALRMTGNESAEAAMQWLFDHIEDPDINVPFQQAGAGAGEVVVDQEKIVDLMGMGFEDHMAKRALQETVPPTTIRKSSGVLTPDLSEFAS